MSENYDRLKDRKDELAEKERQRIAAAQPERPTLAPCRECHDLHLHLTSCGFWEKDKPNRHASPVLDSERIQPQAEPKHAFRPIDISPLNCGFIADPDSGLCGLSADARIHQVEPPKSSPNDVTNYERGGERCRTCSTPFPDDLPMGGLCPTCHPPEGEQVEPLSPEAMLEWIESRRGRVSFTKDAYYFATVPGDQGGGFTREDAIKNLYDDVRADEG